MGDIYLINFAEPQASAPSLLKKVFGASFTINKFGYLVYSQHDESDAVTDEVAKAYPSDDAPDFIVSRGYAGWLDQSIWDAVEKFETGVIADANLRAARTEFNPLYQKLETLQLSFMESLKTESPNYEALSSTTTGMGTLINELKGLHDKLPSPEVSAPFDSLCQKLEAIQQRSFTALAVTRRGLLGIKKANPDYQALSSASKDLESVVADLRGWQDRLLSTANPVPEIYAAERPVATKLKPITAELDGLLGLQKFKDTIGAIAAEGKMTSLMTAADLSVADPPSYHALMLGNAGTGKTTCARIYAKTLHALGVLSSGHLIETDRSGLVGEYVGQTEEKTNSVLASAEGGVLYIDEAYSLFDDYESDFGRLAVAQIVKRMEDNRHDLVIVMAGYPKEMKKLIEMNSGLISRFNFVLDFPDYSTPELLKITHEMLKKNILTPCADFDGVFSEIIEAGRTKDGQKFGNGRFVRNMMHAVSRELSQRLEKEGKLDQSYTADELRALRTITPDDLWVVATTECQIPKPKHTALKPVPKRVVQFEKAEA